MTAQVVTISTVELLFQVLCWGISAHSRSVSHLSLSKDGIGVGLAGKPGGETVWTLFTETFSPI